MNRAIVRVAVIAGVIPLVVGCATRGSVRKVEGDVHQQGQRMSGVEGRLGEESQRTTSLEGRLGEEAQRLEGRLGQETLRLEEKIGATSETVRDAKGRADAAFDRADEVDSRLTRLWTNRHKMTQVESLDVHFGFDKADLNDAAQTALASLVKELQGNPRLGVELHGYTDPRGTERYNLELSRRRVEAVRRYLVQRGVELPRINSIGLGPIIDQGVAAATKRRVTVRMMLQAD